jgi:hypothetical protein
MRRSQRLAAAGVCLLALVAVAPAQTQQPENLAGQQRAGYAQEVAPWARPSDTGGYVGYLVGGGSVNYRKGEPPLPDEGTWGWDYRGGLFQRRVILNWWHGRRNQGGSGAYETDHAKLLPRE